MVGLIFLTPVWIFAQVQVVVGLRSGVIWGRSGTVRRSFDPVSYWFYAVTYALCGVAGWIVVMLLVAHAAGQG